MNAKSKALEISKNTSGKPYKPHEGVLKAGKIIKKVNKCETCGRDHRSHSDYVYRTGSLS